MTDNGQEANWRRTVDYMVLSLDDSADQTQIERATEQLAQQHPAAIIDSFSSLCIALAWRLAEASGAVDDGKKARMARQAIQGMRANPPF
jgi:hypothetical protein